MIKFFRHKRSSDSRPASNLESDDHRALLNGNLISMSEICEQGDRSNALERPQPSKSSQACRTVRVIPVAGKVEDTISIHVAGDAGNTVRSTLISWLLLENR